MKFVSFIKAVAVHLVVLLVPLAVLAQTSGSGGIENPLSSGLSTVPKFIAEVLRIVVMLGLPVVALFLVIAGFKFVAAQGSPGKLTEAKENFVYVIIGALLILGAWVIATLINGTVSQLVGK